MQEKTMIRTGRVVAIAVLLTPFIVMAIVNYFSMPRINNEDEKIDIIIPRGASLNAISDTLLKYNIIDDKEIFRFWVTTLEKDRSLKAGYYEVPLGLNNAQLVNYLSTARSKQLKVTLIEGWRIEQIAHTLATRLNVDSSRFANLARNPEFISGLNIAKNSLEGYLLADTYFMYWGMDEEQLIRFLVKNCMALFTEDVKARLDSMKMTVHQILTLASIIEGEAIFDEERSTISSVYYNRLKKRIKLQADPTIQYILEGPPRHLLYRDLKIDSPYNTYKYYGLPPGPINNPGKNSILAAIYPADTNYLYFVARGDGRHTFSYTAREHSKAKAKFNQIRREVYRKKKNSNP
jgi:UPF0755 protein